MRNSLRSQVIALLVTVFSSQLPSLQAVDILIDTITPATSTNNFQVDASGDAKAAQSFQTTATSYTISEVDLSLKRAPGGSGNFSVAIYSMDGSSNPDSRLFWVAQNASQSSLLSSTGFTTVAFTNTSGTPWTLAPSTDYYIVVQDVTSSAIYWQYWDTASPGLTPTSYNNLYTSSAWSGADSTLPFMMIVTATAVPEPSTWALAGIGCAGLAAASRRRRI